MAQPQQQQESPVGLHGVDDLYFSAKFDDDQGDLSPISDDEYAQDLVSISDDEYAQELQLQETLLSSLIVSQNTIKGSSSSSSSSKPPPSPGVFRLSSSLTPPLSPGVFRASSSSTPQQSPGVFSFSLSSKPQQSTGAFSFSSSSTSPPPPAAFSFSSSSTPPPPAVFSFPLSSKPQQSPSVFSFSSSTKPPPSPPVFLFSSSSTPPLSPAVFRSSSSSTQSPPILRFPSSSTHSSSRAVEINLAPKTEQIKLADDEQEPGEPQVICEICAETRGCDQMFRNKRCDHSFCSDCITKQVATKIQERITVVACPAWNCKGVLELDACRPVLPKELLDKWEDALCEALFLAAPKLYCPFRDCSAMLLDDNEGENIREAECPFCHRLFCARCYAPWHPGVECEVFQSLNKDERGREDLLVRELAGQKKWKRCPKCKFYVEKTQGCLHITCRCRFEFCYACGEQWTPTHGGCQRN